MNNRKLFKNISFFTLFNVINSAIPFLLLPILTTYLSPDDYAIIDIFFNVSLIATPIVGLSVVQSISRYYFEDVDLPKFITTVFLVLVSSGLIFMLISVVITFLAQGFIESYNFPPFIIIVAVCYVIFSQVSEILLILWRVSYKTLQFGVFRVSKTILDLGLSVILIVCFEMGWEGRLIPQFLVAFLFCIIACFLLYRNGFLNILRIDKVYKKEALSFSLPLVFHTLGGNLIGFSDRFFILFMLGLSEVGIYSVGYQIGMVIALLQNSFNQAWVPFFFGKLKEDNYDEKVRIVKISYAYFLLILFLVLVFYLLTPFIYKYFIGSAFTTGSAVVLWILLGYAFNGMYKMVANYLFYLKKTKLIAYMTLGSAILNLILNYLLIQKNGILGAAQATTITFFVLFLGVFILSYKNYKMPWGLNKINT
ncbi:lipopolysaccharide biosynthesis protein [Zobellia barbeyronii]|uniref:Oligosaccharide flippase family protein n=1 Tax=Zobellia barbeyronii TaxID=2748009 RepID=A0ABS5WBK4_9FLAO|nr:oligosaccharide flippase family protein [Zobellia barbeyronii]MBT2160346.1 oligosaccharide flippase family protein [Zobellia barbeyronii]